MIDPIGSAPAGTAMPAKPHDSPEKIREAAGQFEALLLSQLMRYAREASQSGGLGLGDDGANSTAMEMAEEQFARAMAASGGLGLARMIVDGLQKASR